MLRAVLVAALLLVAVKAYPEDSTQIWPQPKTMQTGSVQIMVNQTGFNVVPPTGNSSAVLTSAIARFLDNAFPFNPSEYKGRRHLAPRSGASTLSTLTIYVSSFDETLQLGVDESYSLTVPTTGSAILKSNAIWGALRGLETMSQIILWDPNNLVYYITATPIDISDAPRFPWRGLMIDTARHYQSVATIMRTLDAMAYNKFNTLHWHMVDAESFPASFPSYPQLAEKGAYSADAVYEVSDMQAVVQAALERGIRVVPEFDVPGHAASWGMAFPNITTYCAQYWANINNVPLDPTNPFTYQVLSGIMGDVARTFPDNFIHTGGDEVVFGCWGENTTVQNWMRSHSIPSLAALEGYFEKQLFGILSSNQRSQVVWQEIFQNGNVPSAGSVVEVWESGGVLQQVIDANYNGILAAPYYLDKQSPIGVSHYEWVDTWQDFYNSDPLANLTGRTDLVLGGEGTMWAEQVDSVNFDSRVWPRASAIAERLWSQASVNDVTTAIYRLMSFRCRMAQRGIGAGPVAPDYCPLPVDSIFMNYN